MVTGNYCWQTIFFCVFTNSIIFYYTFPVEWNIYDISNQFTNTRYNRGHTSVTLFSSVSFKIKILYERNYLELIGTVVCQCAYLICQSLWLTKADSLFCQKLQTKNQYVCSAHNQTRWQTNFHFSPFVYVEWKKIQIDSGMFIFPFQHFV